MSEASDKLTAVRALVTVSTQRLLGDTIGVDQDAWRGPSSLPRWTRGHVATHLARQADALGRLVDWARTGTRQEMYASPQVREDEIEQGAGRTGLELQVDLDTSAERLIEAFAGLDDDGAENGSGSAWDTEVELRGGQRVVARLLPLARLTEVVLHHVDLDIGFGVSDVDPETAEWLLEWSAYRLGARDEFPRLELVSDSGFRTTLGSSGDARRVTGSSPALLGWLTGRAGPDTVSGTDGLVLPGL
ncbi:maleylpyruvate isomerase family mycothiol-dependent enzyme [Microlunatus aurantiacus]|uniref:Maleylpyruvate isomerase family mycothiol-dependent enzyme n=1 Tax=Microlunatus aurantiacus TaxID=446786 RepID=A0ABP7DSN8_9ACTN